VEAVVVVVESPVPVGLVALNACNEENSWVKLSGVVSE
jgi:hypothetical protein